MPSLRVPCECDTRRATAPIWITSVVPLPEGMRGLAPRVNSMILNGVQRASLTQSMVWTAPRKPKSVSCLSMQGPVRNLDELQEPPVTVLRIGFPVA